MVFEEKEEEDDYDDRSTCQMHKGSAWFNGERRKRRNNGGE